MTQKPRSRLVPAAGALLTTCLVLFGASSAWAGVGFSVVPNLPPVLTVGQTGVPSTVTITNNSNGVEAGLNAQLGTITLVPTCGTQSVVSADCPPASVDPRVLRVSATGSGQAGTACAGVTFTISNVDLSQDKYLLTPSAPVVLGPAGSATQSCVINFTVDVVKAPTKDANAVAAGLQTEQIGFSDGVATDGVGGFGAGRNEVTINPGSVGIATAVSAATVQLPGSFQDTVTLTPPAGAAVPTGTVTFNVYGPNDTTCAAVPPFSSTNAVNAAGTSAVSSPFVLTAGGTYRVIATYHGDANYLAVSTRCNDPNETTTATLPPAPTISVTKTPNPGSLPAPGGAFQFTVVVTNTSAEALTLTALTDNVYGNLSGQGSCALGASLAANGGTYTCTFTGNFTGAAGASQTDTVTPVATDAFGQTATATAKAVVTLTPAPTTPTPSITVTKTPSPSSLPAPGGSFSFAVVVTNTSNEALTLTALSDNVYGNLAGKGTCATGASLPALGGTYKCTFSGTFTGAAGASQTDTVTPVATDSGGRTTTATAKATVTLTPKSAPAAIVVPSRLSGPASCVQGSFRVTVTGAGIKRVTYYLAGRVVGVLTRGTGGRYSRTIKAANTAQQRVTVKIEYTSKRYGTTHTLSRSFPLCAAPRFTG